MNSTPQSAQSAVRRNQSTVESAYEAARSRYAELGVDAGKALNRLDGISLSIPCWQGDDVGGFENSGASLGAGLAVTGSSPGKARTADELRADYELATSLIPGKHRFNIHASYAEMNGRKLGRDELSLHEFENWVAWAKAGGFGLDFNQTYFAHPKAAQGFTLSHPDKGIRQFWVEHGIRCREIGAGIGAALGQSCLTNLWIPDGMKDTPADRPAFRARLEESLDAIFAQKLDPKLNVDSLEPKLFGIGSESFVVGSHEFYLGYAISRGKLLTLDAGHYHPTESVADKISAVLQFLPEIALHVSRGVRWDSDHVVVLNDDLQAIAREIVANGYLDRVRIALDYFDASINRIAGWVIGARNMLRALLLALLEPTALLRVAEQAQDYTTRLALMEEARTFPVGAVWDYHCLRHDVPVSWDWLAEVKSYEARVLSKR